MLIRDYLMFRVTVVTFLRTKRLSVINSNMMSYWLDDKGNIFYVHGECVTTSTHY